MQEYLTTGDEHTDLHKTQEDERRREKKKRVSRPGLLLGGGGPEAGVRTLHQGNCVGQRGSI